MAKCISPFYKKDTGMSFPCGKCYPCKMRRVSGWSFRLRKEAERSESALFVTITYNPENVPITQKGYMTLDKRHVQLFFKRLRINASRSKKIVGTEGTGAVVKTKKNKIPPKIKYYIAGEYGNKKTDNFRPHYHAIIFNSNYKDIEEAWKNPKTGQSMGEVHFGDLTAASAGYTLKYISKEPLIPQHQNDDRLPEFAFMSKGLGENYLTEKVKKYHKKGGKDRFYLGIEDGKKIAIPRYYKKKIWPDLVVYNQHGEKKYVTNPKLQLIGVQFYNEAIKNYAEKNSVQKLACDKKEDQLREYYSSINKESRNTVL